MGCAQFSSAAGFTARDGALVFGNFSDLSPEDFRAGLEAAAASAEFTEPTRITISDRTFRSDYIDESQYGQSDDRQPGQADPGGQYVRRWSGDLDSLQARFREDLQRELIATGQARPRRDSTGLRAGSEDLAKYGIAPGSKRVTVRRLAEALNARAQDVGAFSPYDTSPEAREAMAQAMADEVAFQLENDAVADTGTGVGWYSVNWPAAQDLGHLLYEIRRALPLGAEGTRVRMAEVDVYGAAAQILRGELTRTSNSSSDTSMPSRITRPQSISRPDLTPMQAPPGSMTTGMSSTSTNLDPGGRDFQSYIEGFPAADGSSDIVIQARASKPPKPPKVRKSRAWPGVNAEIAPNPDTANADRWRLMSPLERQRVTRTPADRYVPRVMEMAGLKGSLEFVQGGFEGETNPAILFHMTAESYKERGYPALLRAAKLIGRFLAQKATIAYDENITPPEVEGVFSSVYAQVSSAAGFTARDGALVFGNFSDLSPEDFRAGLTGAVKSLDIDFTPSDRTFRSDYIDESQYGQDSLGQTEAGGQYVRRWSGDLDAFRSISEGTECCRERHGRSDSNPPCTRQSCPNL